LRICVLGISSFITQVSIFIVISVNNNAVTRLGPQSVYGVDIPMAVIGLCMKTNAIIQGICIGIAAGCAPIISFNFGAKQIDRVRQTMIRCFIIVFAIMSAATLCYELCPQYIVRIFGSGDALYNEFAKRTFRIFLSSAFLAGFQISASIFTQSMGRAVRSMIMSVSRQIVCFIPVMFIMTSIYGLDGMLYSGPVADTLSFLITIAFVIAMMTEFKKISPTKPLRLSQ